MTAAFLGGLFFKGKSGWCTSICPLLPVQRIYGQTPFAASCRNSHCQPCVGCTKNCYDFNPRAAYLADLNDADRYWSGYRKFFVGAFPGLVLGFFRVRPTGDLDLEVYGQFALYMAVERRHLLRARRASSRRSRTRITALFGAMALSIFYWFDARRPGRLRAALGRHRPAPPWRAALRADRARRRLAGAHLAARRRRSPRRPRRDPAQPARAPARPLVASHRRAAPGGPRSPSCPTNKRVALKPGMTLLEIAEANGMHDRGRLPHGHLRRGPGRRSRTAWSTCRRSPTTSGDARAARPGGEHAHGVLRARAGAGRGRAQAGHGRRRPSLSRVAGLQVRQAPSRGRGDRQRHRRRHRGRPRAPPPSRLRDRPDRRGAAPPLQPHGHRAPDLRPLARCRGST